LVGSEAHDRLFARIRRIRADARALIGLLTELEKVTALATGAAPDAALKEKLQRVQRAFADRDLRAHVAELKKLEDQHPELEVYGDRFGAVRNAIEAAQSDQPNPSSSAVTVVNASIAAAKRDLEDAVFNCFRLTIPADVELRLKTMRVGKPFDFEELKDELPDQAERTRLLSELSQRSISGWVDLKSGLIYKLSPNQGFRVFTYLAPLLAVIAAVGVLIGIANVGHLGLALPEGWHLDDAHQLVGAFLLVLVGAIAHLVVENFKQFQMNAVPIVAIGDFFDWLHLRWVGVSMTVVPILVTVIGLRVLGTQSDGADVPLYLFAGYSADSIGGLLLTRFDSSAGAMLKRLTKQLKADDGKAPAAPA
jgi:hypothetical protein